MKFDHGFKIIDENSKDYKFFPVAEFVWRYMKPFKWLFFRGSLYLLISVALSMVSPYVLKILIDDYFPKKDLKMIIIASLSFFAAEALCQVFKFLQKRAIGKSAEYCLNEIRNASYHKLSRAPAVFFDRNPIGRMVNRITNDVFGIQDIFEAGVMSILMDVIIVICVGAAMAFISVKMMLITFSMIPVIYIFSKFVSPALRRNFSKVQMLSSKLTGQLAEQISGMKEIQLFGKEKEFLEELSVTNDEAYEASRALVGNFSTLFPAVEFFTVLGGVFMLLVGAREVVEGTLPLGSLVALLTYSGLIYQPIRDLTEKWSVFVTGMVSVERVRNLVDFPIPDEKTYFGERLGNLLPIEGSKPILEFKDVTLTYDFNLENPNLVLKGINFKINRGEKLALVGRTGAGKTSIVQAAMGFYPIRGGNILLDGRDIRTLGLETVRKKVAYIQQDLTVFRGTIKQNIELGQTFNELELLHAIKVLKLDQAFRTSMDKILDYELHEKGMNISSGQKQMLAFARLFIRKPEIIILDEASSYLDFKTEELVTEALEIVLKDVTSIIIAHRLSTIMNADRILVIDQGKVIEEGNHGTLVEHNGKYAQLVKNQELSFLLS